MADLVPPLPPPPSQSSEAGIEMPCSLPPCICFTYCTSNQISFPTTTDLQSSAKMPMVSRFATLLFSLVGCQRTTKHLYPWQQEGTTLRSRCKQLSLQIASLNCLTCLFLKWVTNTFQYWICVSYQCIEGYGCSMDVCFRIYVNTTHTRM